MQALVRARSRQRSRPGLTSVPIRGLLRAREAAAAPQTSSYTPLSRQQTPAPVFLNHPFPYLTRVFHEDGSGILD